MAIAKGIFKMNGAFGTASCYSLPGSDQMIVRTKGGPSKRRMKVGPEFEIVRKHQSEWKACVLFSQAMKYAMGDAVVIAGINTANDLLNVRKLPYFRLVMSFGIISDIHYVAEDKGGVYVSDLNKANGVSKSCATEWFSAQDNLPEIKLELQFRDTYKSIDVKNSTCILSLGIEFGTVGFASKIDPVKYSGAGKIMMVV